MRKNTGAFLLCGGGIGLINGALGGGGGMLAVPALQRVGGLPARRAHATAIAVILPASALSAIVYLLYGLIPLNVLLPVALGTLTGGFFGAKLLKSLSVKGVELLFFLLMLWAGIKMLF